MINNFLMSIFNDTIQDKFFNSSSVIDRDNKVYVNFTLDTIQNIKSKLSSMKLIAKTIR